MKNKQLYNGYLSFLFRILKIQISICGEKLFDSPVIVYRFGKFHLEIVTPAIVKKMPRILAITMGPFNLPSDLFSS